MSNDPSNTGTVGAGGRGSTGGGGGAVVTGHLSGSAGPCAVTNQTVLALDGHVYAHLSAGQTLELKLIQLEFARDVAARAATAYEQIIAALRIGAERG